METRKIGDIVPIVVKKLRTREQYHEFVIRFLKDDCRIAMEGMDMRKQDKTLVLYTQDPQRFYRVQVYRERLLEYLKEQLPACGIEEIAVRIKDYGRP